MSLEGLLRQSNLLIVAGKGGVGKTVVAAAAATAGRRLGRRVLSIDVEGRPHPAAQDHRTIRPDDALAQWLTEHGMAGLARRLARSGSMDVIASGTPGIRELLVLGRIKQLVRDGGAEQLVVVDAPASGHAVSLLGVGRALETVAGSGPIPVQARQVREMLEDHERTQVVLVTLPATTPVGETIETAYALEDRLGIRLGPVVVNRVTSVLHPVVPDGEPPVPLPPAALAALRAAAEERCRREDDERSATGRLAAELPLPQVHLPDLDRAQIGRPELEELAGALLDGSVPS